MWLYDRWDQVSFLGGYARAFARFCGVSERLVYDKLPLAVGWRMDAKRQFDGAVPDPAEYRQQMVDLVRSGRSPDRLARELESPARSTRPRWLRQTGTSAVALPD